MNQTGGALGILIGAFVVILTLTILMQPVGVLVDEARDSLTTAGSTIKYGTNADGVVEAVGTSSALPDVTTIFMYLIGLAILGGFIVWVIRYGKGGYYQEFGDDY